MTSIKSSLTYFTKYSESPFRYQISSLKCLKEFIIGLSQCFCQIVSEQPFFAENQRTPTAVIEKNEKENYSSFCDFFELSFCFICFVWKSVVNIYIKYYRNILIIVKKKNLPLISHTVIYFFYGICLHPNWSNSNNNDNISDSIPSFI